VPRTKRIESVFLNDAFEPLYLAYIVGLTQLGLRINAALAVPNQGRLNTIIQLIEQSDFSIHDLSRIEYLAAFRGSTCLWSSASLFIGRTLPGAESYFHF
jgi:hypothetical protein